MEAANPLRAAAVGSGEQHGGNLANEFRMKDSISDKSSSADEYKPLTENGAYWDQGFVSNSRIEWEHVDWFALQPITGRFENSDVENEFQRWSANGLYLRSVVTEVIFSVVIVIAAIVPAALGLLPWSNWVVIILLIAGVGRRLFVV